MNEQFKMNYIDEIHGNIKFSDYILEIVDTVEFQRLRNIKQLGSSDLIFPSATHTRFVHSLGVCHLSDVLLNHLEKNTGFKISDLHRKCVKIAGLLHDVGHGPYSHLWDKFVRKKRCKDWNHEQSSCAIVEQIFHNENGIQLHEDRKTHEDAVKLICSLILGNCTDNGEHSYLFEIIHNKYSEIDVDKWDYILRDLFYLNNAISLPQKQKFPKLFKGASVLKDENGVTHISYDKNDYPLIEELFHNRRQLHKKCYQHPKVAMIEQMIVNILLSAENSGFLFKGVKLSEAHLNVNVNVYKYLDDTILETIFLSNDSKLKEAQELIKRIKNRKLYKIIKIKEGYQSNRTSEKDSLRITQTIPGGKIPKIFSLTDLGTANEKETKRQILYLTE